MVREDTAQNAPNGRSRRHRSTDRGERATEILLRALVWLRILQAGGRGEDIVLFVVTVALLMWALGYLTGWLIFRAGRTWLAVVLSAVIIPINYTFTYPKPTQLFFVFLSSALLLMVYQNVAQQQRLWRAALIEFPTRGFPARVGHRFFDLRQRRIRPVLAHPERYEPVWKDTSLLDPLLDGGTVLLLDVAALGLDCVEVSDRLLEQQVAATPMRGWGGETADRHVRFVFSNEPVERLQLLGERVREALDATDRVAR